MGGLQLDLTDLKDTSVGTYVKLVCDGQLALTLVRKHEEMQTDQETEMEAMVKQASNVVAAEAGRKQN